MMKESFELSPEWSGRDELNEVVEMSWLMADGGSFH